MDWRHWGFVDDFASCKKYVVPAGRLLTNYGKSVLTKRNG